MNDYEDRTIEDDNPPRIRPRGKMTLVEIADELDRAADWLNGVQYEEPRDSAAEFAYFAQGSMRGMADELRFKDMRQRGEEPPSLFDEDGNKVINWDAGAERYVPATPYHPGHVSIDGTKMDRDALNLLLSVKVRNARRAARTEMIEAMREEMPKSLLRIDATAPVSSRTLTAVRTACKNTVDALVERFDL